MSTLEERYRRLLEWYPAGHRAEYAEDMLGVLMDDARPGQTRPTVAVRADLLRGALAAWVTRLRTGLSPWTTSEAPGVVAIFALAGLCMTAVYTTVLPVSDFWGRGGHGVAEEYVLQSSGISWLLVAALAVAGLGRAAATVAWAVGIAFPLITSFLDATYLWQWNGRGFDSTQTLVWVLAAGGLSADPGLRRGARAIGRAPIVAAGAGVLGLGTLNIVLLLVGGDYWECSQRGACPSLGAGALGVALVAVAVLLVAGAAVLAMTRTARSWAAAFAVCVVGGVVYLIPDAYRVGHGDDIPAFSWIYDCEYALYRLPLLIGVFLAVRTVAHARVAAREPGTTRPA